MQRTFLSNLILLIILNLLVKPIWVLGIEVKVQNVLGPGVYGDYFSLLNFAFLFSMVLDFGLTNYNNRKISREPELMQKVLVQTSLAKVLLSGLFITSLYIGAWVLGYEPHEFKLLSYISVMLILQSFLLYARSNLSGIQWYKADVLVSVLDKSIMIILVGLLLFTNVFEVEFNIIHFILMQCVAYTVSILVVAVLLIGKTTRINFKVSRHNLLQIFKESWRYALLAFLMLIYFRVDAVMIERMLPEGDLEAGYYAQGYKLLEAAVMFAFLFSSLLLPMFSHMLAEKKSVSELAHLGSRLLFYPALVLVSLAVCYNTEFMELLYQQGTSESAPVLQLLILVLLPLGASYIFGTLITAEGDLKLLNQISVVAIVVNCVANYFLINSIGIVGAALATLITQGLVSLIQWVTCIKRHDLTYSQMDIFKFIAYSAILVVLTYSSSLVDYDWKIKVVAVAAVSLALLFVMKIFKLADFRNLLQSQHSS